ncbi:MAG: hypothetical protein EON85_03235 [Brevundimonas sp.]|nr:MAG: hypothetical protein EON85_03235 [Brevundimonas sp.]
MIEESFVRLYAHDFVQLAWRSEIGQPVIEPLRRRMDDLRRHSDLMLIRKGADHLTAVIARLRDEAERFNPRMVQKGIDPLDAQKRHRIFLLDVAEQLSAAPMAEDSTMSLPAIRRRR